MPDPPMFEPLSGFDRGKLSLAAYLPGLFFPALQLTNTVVWQSQLDVGLLDAATL